MKSYVVPIFGLIMLTLFLYGRYQIKVTEVNRIKTDYSITVGVISQFEKELVRNTISTQYSYTVNTKKYEASFINQEPCDDLSKETKNILKKSKFPVIYSRKHPALSRILIRPKDFKNFDLAFPDSLHSVYTKYFKACEDDIIRIKW